MTLIDGKLLKFLLVGIINTLIGCGVMFFLYNALSMSYWFSSACNYIVGGIVSFVLNKFFTFQDTQKSVSQGIRFIITVVVCYVLAYGIAKNAVLHVLTAYPKKTQENIALFCGIGLYTILNYLGQRYFVFTQKGGTEK